VSVPKREGLVIGLFLFLTLGAAVSAQASFGGPNPLSMLVLFFIIFTLCSITLGTAKILLYRAWHQRSSYRGKLFYLVSSAIELGSVLVIGGTFKFDETVMVALLALYWVLELLVNPLVLRYLNPQKHARYFKALPFSVVQAMALPMLGLVVYLISSATN
jgi:hypothetical protein